VKHLRIYENYRNSQDKIGVYSGTYRQNPCSNINAKLKGNICAGLSRLCRRIRKERQLYSSPSSSFGSTSTCTFCHFKDKRLSIASRKVNIDILPVNKFIKSFFLLWIQDCYSNQETYVSFSFVLPGTYKPLNLPSPIFRLGNLVRQCRNPLSNFPSDSDRPQCVPHITITGTLDRVICPTYV